MDGSLASQALSLGAQFATDGQANWGWPEFPEPTHEAFDGGKLRLTTVER